ncbi:MAG: thiamine-monophosphate kinase [Micavibrio sp.]|nr:MAG: thiamine-monophosphate kinase [Micavibrio sp.]
MSEFSIIEKYFEPLSKTGALDDDAAVLDVPQGQQLVVTSDTSNRGDHFVEELSPSDAARKCLRSNLSDLAAMGADPFVYQLNLALPKEIDEQWLAGFAGGLEADQKEFGILLSGGDTTAMSAGALSVSITALGLVPPGEAVPRGGAQPGDLVVVTGPLGDACLDRLRLPYPRTAIAPLIRRYAKASVDISDGLPADLGHICAVSGLAAQIEFAKIPFSKKVQEALRDGKTTPQDILTWGEDYELALAVAPEDFESFKAEAVKQGVEPVAIGDFTEGNQEVQVLDESGKPLSFQKTGWQHF